MSVLSVLIGLLVTAVVLAIAWKFYCVRSSKKSSRAEQYTLPVHQPQQYQPVSQPLPCPPLPPRSYRSSPYTPPVHQPEQHQPVYLPLPPRLPPSQSYPPSPHEQPKHEDDDQTDRSDEYYNSLCARANNEGDEMVRCFSESREAYSRGDRAAAKILSNQGKFHKQSMQQLNKEASNGIYLKNNRDRKLGEIDLHGLYVKEAVAYTDAALEEAKLRGDSEIRFIVGRGLHSEDGEAKLGPAIKGLMRKYQLGAEFDPSNCGVLVVELNERPPIRHRQHLDNSNRRSRRHKRRASNIGA
ncbi:hypothetical protein IW261DRAFT_265787 [Armillaria novae-zelandiae]|uniref:Smr domain-containing protein n=1 Tax=Armillaria novae-zelandiae TaxID=153914 RepID=A0AA39P4Q6_9AGAR|nr:hypothetical protein IW261DRAFT_265787 [Armillaria novae-zelandiae]